LIFVYDGEISVEGSNPSPPGQTNQSQKALEQKPPRI